MYKLFFTVALTVLAAGGMYFSSRNPAGNPPPCPCPGCCLP